MNERPGSGSVSPVLNGCFWVVSADRREWAHPGGTGYRPIGPVHGWRLALRLRPESLVELRGSSFTHASLRVGHRRLTGAACVKPTAAGCGITTVPQNNGAIVAKLARSAAIRAG